jgi:glutamyl-tRNA synthetase
VHIGNIRVAIFNWLFARHEDGKFLLRIEDTDRERSTPAAVDAILEVMDWLGLGFDEQPLYQSSRSGAHLAAADRLLRDGRAYREDKGGTGRGECVVFRMPSEDVAFADEIKGELRKSAGDLRDFVIVRSDGSPTFHLANIVDDIEMGVTHIIRGDDHIENTYRHVAVYAALGARVPRYAHLPMVVNQHGKPYSKRDGDFFVGEFRDRGYHPEALFNYLALLGWSPGDDREQMTRTEMIESFTLERVKSGPAQMDVRKLTHLNARYVAEMPLDQFVACVRDALGACSWAGDADEAYFLQVAELMQSRTHLYDHATQWAYFFSDDFEYEDKAVRKGLRKEGVREALLDLGARMADMEFSEASIESAIRAAETAAGVKEGKLNYPVRVAVTGRAAGAGIYETMALLGRERVLSRLGHAAERLCA